MFIKLEIRERLDIFDKLFSLFNKLILLDPIEIYKFHYPILQTDYNEPLLEYKDDIINIETERIREQDTIDKTRRDIII
jgi:hypothetical protein